VGTTPTPTPVTTGSSTTTPVTTGSSTTTPGVPESGAAEPFLVEAGVLMIVGGLVLVGTSVAMGMRRRRRFTSV
jgi:hypothetical protein